MTVRAALADRVLLPSAAARAAPRSAFLVVEVKGSILGGEVNRAQRILAGRQHVQPKGTDLTAHVPRTIPGRCSLTLKRPTFAPRGTPSRGVPVFCFKTNGGWTGRKGKARSKRDQGTGAWHIRFDTCVL